MVKIFKNVFTEQTHDDIYKIFHNDLDWKMHNVSETGDNQKFWYADGGKHSFISDSVRESLIPTFERELNTSNFEYMLFFFIKFLEYPILNKF